AHRIPHELLICPAALKSQFSLGGAYTLGAAVLPTSTSRTGESQACPISGPCECLPVVLSFPAFLLPQTCCLDLPTQQAFLRGCRLHRPVWTTMMSHHLRPKAPISP